MYLIKILKEVNKINPKKLIKGVDANIITRHLSGRVIFPF